MTARVRILIAGFFVVHLLSWVTYYVLWLSPWWWSARVVLGVVALLLAGGILWTVRPRWRGVLLVLVGLTVGQWWLIQGFLARLAWFQMTR